MSAYIILLTIALLLGIVCFVSGIWVGKQWVQYTLIAIFIVCLLLVIFCGFAFFAMSMNEDIVVERRTYREMVGRGEIDVYDDLGHINRDAAKYNIEIAKMQKSIRKYGCWSVWYGTGADELTPITKEG